MSLSNSAKTASVSALIAAATRTLLVFPFNPQGMAEPPRSDLSMDCAAIAAVFVASGGTTIISLVKNLLVRTKTALLSFKGMFTYRGSPVPRTISVLFVFQSQNPTLRLHFNHNSLTSEKGQKRITGNCLEARTSRIWNSIVPSELRHGVPMSFRTKLFF